MITGNASKNQSLNWQKLLADAIRDPLELFDLLELKPEEINQALFNPEHFPLRVPRGFAEKMRKGDWNDPLLLQVLPLNEEANNIEGFLLDPVSDLEAVSQKGVLQKYHGRALIMTTGACAVHCRYCFRQHFPYTSHQASQGEWKNIISTLQSDKSLNEVILSGGDPLSLSDQRLQDLCFQIDAIPHIKRLRIHTRQPLVLPERIDDLFMQWFEKLTVQTIMVIHANHANEFCSKTHSALDRLHRSGTLLLNQSVLLKGINDNSHALIQLSNTLLEQKVQPYYLHLLDRVQGAAHFEVDEQQALGIIKELRESLPGYLVPQLVREISGKRSKTPII